MRRGALWLAAVLSGISTMGDSVADPQRDERMEEGRKPLLEEDIVEIRKWLSELGDRDFDVREEATRSLLAMGSRIVPLVRAERDASGDAEVVVRCGQILDKICAPRRVDRIRIHRSGRYQWRLRGANSANRYYFFLKIPGRDQDGSPYLRFCGGSHGRTPAEQTLDLGYMEEGEEIVLVHRMLFGSGPEGELVSSQAGEKGQYLILEIPENDVWRVSIGGGPCGAALIYLERTGKDGEKAPADPIPDMAAPRKELEDALSRIAADRIPVARSTQGDPITDDPAVADPAAIERLFLTDRPSFGIPVQR